jgi:hypothetical protein
MKGGAKDMKGNSRFKRRQDLRDSLIKAWIERKAEDRQESEDAPAERKDDEKAD